MGSERQAFVVPAGLLVEQTPQGLALTFPGDVVLEAALSFPVARIRSETGDVVLAADMEVAQIEAPAGVVRARSGLRTQRIVAREVQITGNLQAGSVYAERIRVDGDCTSDRLVAERGGLQLGGNTRIKEELVANGGDIVVAGTLHAGRVLCPQGRILLRNDAEASSIQAGRSLTLQGRTKAEDLRAGDAVEAYEILEARSIRADAVRLTGPRTELRLVQARSVISVGPGKITADVFIAPVVDLSSRASGRVTVVECHNTLGPSAVTGKLRLTELASLIGDVDQFLADRGLDRLPDGSREIFAPEPELLPEDFGSELEATQANVEPLLPTPAFEPVQPEPAVSLAPPVESPVDTAPAAEAPAAPPTFPGLPIPEERISESITPVAAPPAEPALPDLTDPTPTKPDLAAVLAAALADLEAEGFGSDDLDGVEGLTEAELEEAATPPEATPPTPTTSQETDFSEDPIAEESPERMSESESEWLSSADEWNFDDPDADAAENAASTSTGADAESPSAPRAAESDAPVAHDTHEYAPTENSWETDQTEWAQTFSDPPASLPEEGPTGGAEDAQNWPEEGDSKSESLDWWGDEGDINLDEIEFDSLEAREPTGTPVAPTPTPPVAGPLPTAPVAPPAPPVAPPTPPEAPPSTTVAPPELEQAAEGQPGADESNPADLDWWDDSGLNPEGETGEQASESETDAHIDAQSEGQPDPTAQRITPTQPDLSAEAVQHTATADTDEDSLAEERRLREMIGELGDGPAITPAAPTFQATDLITDRALEAPSAQIKPLSRESRAPIEAEPDTTGEGLASDRDMPPESQEEVVFDASDIPDEPEEGAGNGAEEEATARSCQAEPSTDELVARQLAAPAGRMQGHPMPELEADPGPAAAIFDMSREGTENVEVVPVRPPSGPQPAGQGQLMLIDEAVARTAPTTPEVTPAPPPLVMPKPTLQAVEPVPLSWSQGAQAPSEGEPASATLIAQNTPEPEAKTPRPAPTFAESAPKAPISPTTESQPNSPVSAQPIAQPLATPPAEPSPVLPQGNASAPNNRRAAPPLPLPSEAAASAPAPARGPTVPYKAPAEAPADPVYSLMLETMGRIRNSYDGRALPPPIEEINTLLASRDYQLIRESFPTLVTALVEHHRGRSEQLNPKVSHQLRIIDTLVRNL